MSTEDAVASLTEQGYLARATSASPRLQGRNLFLAHTLEGPLDVAALDRAVKAVVAANEAFRSTFVREAGGLVRRIHAPEDCVGSLEVADAIGASMDDVLARLGDDVAYPFDSAVDLRPRTKLYRLGDDRFVFLLLFSAYVFDGGCYGVVLRQLSAVYARPDAPLSPTTGATLADFAAWQRGILGTARQEELTTFWRDRLAACKRINEQMPKLQPEAKRGGAVIGFKVDEDKTSRVRAAASAARSNILGACGGAIARVLARFCGADEVALVYVHNIRSQYALRNRHLRKGLEDVVGRMPNVLPISFAAPSSAPTIELVQNAHRAIRDASIESDLPLPVLGLELPPLGVTLNYMRLREALELPGVAVTRVPKHHIERNFLSQRTLQFILVDGAQDLTGRLVYDDSHDSLFSEPVVRTIVEDFVRELDTFGQTAQK